MVYDNISLNAAQLKLHIANLDVREYTTAQKLQFYSDTEQLLHSMKESGEYTGPIQQGIAELLGVSERQVRKYKTITGNLLQDQLQQVVDGKISLNDAYKLAQPPQVFPQDDKGEQSWDQLQGKTGTGSGFGSYPDESSSASLSEQFEPDMQETGTGSDFGSRPDDSSPASSNEQYESDIQKSGTGSGFGIRSDDSFSVSSSRQHEPDMQKSGTGSAFDNSFWDDKIKFAIKCHYNTKSLFIFYIFEVPTTQEAIKEILKPCNEYGDTVIYSDGIRGNCTCRSPQMDIEYNREHVILTYTQVDSYIRDMIRAGEWLSAKEIHNIIEKKLNEIRAKSGSTSAFKKE